MSGLTSLAVALTLAIGSDPYVRSRVDTGISNDPHAHCLWWGVTALQFHQDSAGNPETTGTTEFDAAVKSLASWQAVSDSCGSLQITEGARESDRKIGFNPTGTNKNNILYRMKYCAATTQTASANVPTGDACWKDSTCNNKYDCWQNDKGTIALTTTTYDTQTGQIYDADIEFNGAWFVFTTVDSPPCVYDRTAPDLGYNQSCVATDVQNTLTHELGHAFGLDHTTYAGSTMNATAPAGETSKRSIDEGTAQFICDVYPKGAPARDCIISTVDQELGDKAGCSATSAAPFGAFAVLGWALMRRRRKA